MNPKYKQKILSKHLGLTWLEIKTIANSILKVRRNKIRQGYILDFTIPHLGRFKTHGNKKTRRFKKTLIADRRRKRLIQRKKDIEKHKKII